MENRRRQKSSSGDKFSFPVITPVDEELDSNFEFGSPIIPDSPADRLFFNGKLLPHDFPCQPPSFAAGRFSYSWSASSVSSKDSLMSSRSNSSNSSSARTSTSECSSERKVVAGGGNKNTMRNSSSGRRPLPASSQGQRWQFMATPVDLRNKRHISKKNNNSSSSNNNNNNSKELKLRKQGENDDEIIICKRSSSSSSWFGLKNLIKSFVSTCKECHAIQPSKRENIHKVG